ncbi:hypothetical protein CKAN_02464200 [Cinnamomum micranthum f. kanehirae]|uniref:Uncharacterized protein n=1 Tax=Cinnamomum micranthum f. kanehirae TaxID=337451 RepID=A0A443PX45_9MAGN|nr:hypothetical protein CKAN_02464200 [Cinnamomum micranthum f. kanehirae]
MADLEMRGSEGPTFLKGFIGNLKELGIKFEFVPGGMAAGQKSRYSPLDSFGEVPYVVEEDGGFKLADSNPKFEKPKVYVFLKDANVLMSTAHPHPHPHANVLMSTAHPHPHPHPHPVALSKLKVVHVWGLKQFVVPRMVLPNPVYPGVDSPSKDMGVESFDLVDSLQRHVEAKYCCCFGLSKCKGVDSFEHSCVDVHACCKGTWPWLAPRGPRISKLSRTDTAAAAPAPSRPFSFRASLTVSLSVVFE